MTIQEARDAVLQRSVSAGHSENDVLKVDALIDACLAEGRAQTKQYVAWLGEIYAATGADPDDNSDTHLAPFAVEEVHRLRREYDQQEAQLLAAHAEIARLKETPELDQPNGSVDAFAGDKRTQSSE